MLNAFAQGETLDVFASGGVLEVVDNISIRDNLAVDEAANHENPVGVAY